MNTRIVRVLNRNIIFVALLFASLVSGALPASANHGAVTGATWFADGTPHSGPEGSTISVRAVGAYADLFYYLAAELVGEGKKPCGEVEYLAGLPGAISGLDGSISTVSASLTLARGLTLPGDYWVCFSNNGDTFTAPVVFTLLSTTN